jgi:hypothetical protein
LKAVPAHRDKFHEFGPMAAADLMLVIVPPGQRNSLYRTDELTPPRDPETAEAACAAKTGKVARAVIA